ncbi:MAG: ABC transporter permease [Acetobacteraceae bacterium]
MPTNQLLRAMPMGNPWFFIIPAGLVLVVFFVVPFLMTLAYSVVDDTEFASGRPLSLTLDHYRTVLGEPYFFGAYLRTLLMGFAPVIAGTLVAYPVAYFLVFGVTPAWRRLLLFLLIAPFWTSFTVRAFSWQLILSDQGMLGWTIRTLGLGEAAQFMHSTPAALLGLSLFTAALLTLTLYTTLETLDPRWIEAAEDLGASKTEAFRYVILPLSLPGWMVGALLGFIVCVGDYAVPQLLGSSFEPVVAQLMENSVRATLNLPVAAVYAVILVVTIVVVAAPTLRLLRTSGA